MEPDISLIDTLIAYGQLDADRRRELVDRLASNVPTRAQWATFLHTVGLGFGTASALAGVIYLVAFNWFELGIASKLGLLSVALICCAAGSIAAGPRTFPGQLLAIAAVVLVGSCLVVYSQVYQSGADPWTLFAAWSALALPFLAGARSPPLWALQFVLLDATLGTALLSRDDPALGIVTVAALLHVAVAQAFAGTWLLHVLRLAGVAWLTGYASAYAFAPNEFPFGLAALASILLGNLAIQGAFLARLAAPPAAALGYVSAATVLTSALVRGLLDRPSAFDGGFALLLIGTIVVVITGVGFVWVLGVPMLQRSGSYSEAEQETP